MEIPEELKKALEIFDHCPWFPQNRSKECNCSEYNRYPRILIAVNNKCLQHGLKETNELPQKSL